MGGRVAWDDDDKMEEEENGKNKSEKSGNSKGEIEVREAQKKEDVEKFAQEAWAYLSGIEG